jgi:hypothetical protein
MEVIAVRTLTVDGVTYQPGEPVKGLPADKAAQLVAQRWLRQEREKTQEYVATRSFPLKGKIMERGKRIRVSSLTPDKLHQLLEQRYLEPAV